MNRQTIDEVLAYSGRAPFETVDITGGAPEMNPSLGHLIENIAPLTPRIMLRSNLTALADYQTDSLTDLCRKHRVVVVASLPSVNPSQTDSQRGKGVWEKSIHVLRKLNEIGYGHEGTGLELNLVSNPTGAFLPTRQCQAEKRFKNDLKRKWGLVFNNLFAFANVPLGRFRAWLEASGNLERYMQKLSTSFNPSTVQGLMCRTSVSVSWDGYLFDCDFNLARGAYLGARRRHISEMEGTPAPGSPIPAGDHCYACTAGSGFT
jgi:radical SAM/Cys-rich protein